MTTSRAADWPRRRLPVFSLAVLTLVACSDSSPRETASPIAPSGSASLAGQIFVDGPIPAAARIRFDADPQCLALTQGEDTRDDIIAVGEHNTLRNVFVSIKAGLPDAAWPARKAAVVLDQQKCRYTPRVVGVQVGQPLTMRNSDPLLHTVRGDAVNNQRFAIATPIQGMAIQRTFHAPEWMIPIKCDMHPWMQAHVAVMEHPFYAVTDDAGRFLIDALPPGQYVVEAWHERLGTRQQRVTIETAQRAAVTFRFGTE